MKPTLKKWQQLHRRLVNEGNYRTARRLLLLVQWSGGTGYCRMSLYCDDDWFLASELDPGNNGYNFKLS